jgi:hypothetical protein
VKSHDPTRLDKRTPGAPIGQQAVLAMITVDEHEVDRRMIARGFGASRTNPRHGSVSHRVDLAMSNPLLNAESEPPNRERIDSREQSVSIHRRS